MAEWDCPYCEKQIDYSSTEQLKQVGKSHLVGDHRSELAEGFKRSHSGKKCQGCSRQIPEETNTRDHLICPNCGHDHASWWAGFSQFQFWNVGD